jgi:hypothetical protein
MALIQKKTAEERALIAEERASKAAAKDQQRQAAQSLAAAQREADNLQRLRKAFLASPPGQARAGFERGDQVFQYAIDVMSQQAIIIAMIGGTTSKKTTDPTEVLNSVCNEGWELVNGSFVFVEQGQESRDKFLASGQNVAIKGTTVGYYLFKRCEQNRREPVQAWEGATEVTVT